MKIAAIAKVIKDRGSCRLYRVHGADNLETKFYIGTNSEIYSLEGFPKPWSEAEVMTMLGIEKKKWEDVIYTAYDCNAITDVCGLNLEDAVQNEVECKTSYINLNIGGALLMGLTDPDEKTIDFIAASKLVPVMDEIKKSDYTNYCLRRAANGLSVLCYPGRHDRAGSTSARQSVRQFAGNDAEDGEHGSGNGTTVQNGGQRGRMILAKEAIEKAVNWWAEKILEDRPHSNGDDSFTSITACLLADMGRQNITSDQADTFKKALAKSMTEYAESGRFNHFSIMSDYGPCGMLIDAANEAGISAANFPFKTTMFVTEKDGIMVRDGYGAPVVKLWG